MYQQVGSGLCYVAECSAEPTREESAMNLEDAVTDLAGNRVYVGLATDAEVERLMIEPAAALREAGADIGDRPPHIRVSRLYMMGKSSGYDKPGEGFYDLIIYPGIDGNVVISVSRFIPA
jgi:hypothetical protein